MADKMYRFKVTIIIYENLSITDLCFN